MAETIRLVLAGNRLLSRNQLDKMKWPARHRLSKRLKREVGLLILSSRLKKSLYPLQRAVVSITSYRKALLDPDNLTAGAKSYIDALVTNGLLIDDKPENIKLTVNQVRAGKYETVIEVQTE
jgi:hypothetical protein